MRITAISKKIINQYENNNLLENEGQRNYKRNS